MFLGSGGHTSELLSLLSDLDFSRYFPRTYIVSDGDALSARKAQDFENNKSNKKGSYEIFTIPRARRVHQSLFSTPPTALRSLLVCVYHMMYTGQLSSDVLLLNGPGTCFVLCISAYVNRFMGLPSPKLIYIESFARVNSLSLSGKLLRPFVDKFIVQWPDLVSENDRGEYHGWLI
ncbi:oligosaccharide biosynthesis protein Alg14 like protein [Schizopora paradoxa]|uniref:UDP-N-acetylglucosamine transferase subunit ALG14 n=1 Tax=Schizopora paradoxa TaxID=27342 RepID=A0A0H2RV09_9AGAM|nr:oligosaccharide biosynthesis protein Alg14 like protein [Schizopora paradoxa]